MRDVDVCLRWADGHGCYAWALRCASVGRTCDGGALGFVIGVDVRAGVVLVPDPGDVCVLKGKQAGGDERVGFNPRLRWVDDLFVFRWSGRALCFGSSRCWTRTLRICMYAASLGSCASGYPYSVYTFRRKVSPKRKSITYGYERKKKPDAAKDPDRPIAHLVPRACCR